MDSSHEADEPYLGVVPHPCASESGSLISQSFSGSQLSASWASRASSRGLSNQSRTASRTTSRTSTLFSRSNRRSATPSVLGQNDSQNIICAVSEARGVSPTVGMAFFNVSLGVVTLTQIAEPSRIVFTSTVCPPNPTSTLYELTKDIMPEAQLDSFDRSAWSEIAGLEYLQDLAFEAGIEPLKVAIEGKFYATASLAAVMRFVEQQFSISFQHHSLRITYRPTEDTMMIDISVIQSLEVMQNQQKPKSKHSLFGLLNNTLTPMGARILRNNILQPPTKYEEFIKPRQEALEEITSKEGIFYDVRKALKPFVDVEKLVTKLIIRPKVKDIAFVEDQINQVLMIKSFLEAVPELHQALLPAQSDLLNKVREACRPEVTSRILRMIRRVIEPDVKYVKSALDLRNQRTFAVKSGINGMLDVSRQTYKELTDEVHKHIDYINETYNMFAVLKFDNARKYWLRIKTIQCEEQSLPDVLINCIRKKDNFECQTLDLVKLNLRLSDISNEVIIRSDEVVSDLIRNLRSEASHLFQVCESVALVDMIASFGQLATTHDYVRPEITGTLALDNARHPILDHIEPESYVPNDYYAAGQHRFHIITGCNMSGKSTYIRATALLQIMAQIGSFVPAKYASFSIVRTIFARVSTDDNIEANLSTFSVEMREMAFILRNIDEHSLAIIDELGRGTSTQDGLAIAIAMSEALIQSRAIVWFATHFLDLPEVLKNRPGVLNMHLATTNTTTTQGIPKVIMLYKATSGIVDSKEHYGINLAKAIGFPEEFIRKAEEVAHDLRQKREANSLSSESRKLYARRKLVLNLHEALQQARDSGHEETLLGYLQQLQEHFILRMEEIEST